MVVGVAGYLTSARLFLRNTPNISHKKLMFLLERGLCLYHDVGITWNGRVGASQTFVFPGKSAVKNYLGLFGKGGDLTIGSLLESQDSIIKDK